MKPPFPGMDPWLEGHVWPDVHHDLATKFKEQIVPQVIPKYFVRVETYTFEDTSPEEEVGIMYPDVEILKKRPEARPRPALEEEAGDVAVLTPATSVIPRPVIEMNIPVVKGHGGTLEVETREREGTEFILHFPAKKEQH